jgi:type IV pilus assembly protein PilV
VGIKPEGGFSLIEVLAAVFVLAIGVLGTAASQLAALQTRQHTGLMSSGVQLASSLADRMRANAQQMQAGGGLYLFDYDALGASPPSAPGALCFGGAACSSGQMAAFDIYEIKKAVHEGFPGGRVMVCRDAAGGKLSWQCGGGAGAPLVVKLGWRTRSDDPHAEAQFVPFVAILAGGSLP